MGYRHPSFICEIFYDIEKRVFFQNISGAQLALIRIIQNMSAGPKINKILKRAALNWSFAEKLTLRS